MRNKKVVRIQLAILAVLTILVVGRVLIGPGEPEGVVVMSDLDEAELRFTSFHLGESEPFLLEATGSLENGFDPALPLPPLAAYPWIINRRTREIVWQMEPANVKVERGTAVHAATTLTLNPGRYDVFFTTYGSSRASRRRGGLFSSLFGTHWTADSDRWNITLRSAREAGSSATVTSDEDAAALAPGGVGVVWTSAPMKGYSKAHFAFELDAPGRVRAYAVGELCRREECDIGWIEEAFSGRKVWEMKELNSRYAGGMEENRVSDTMIELAPGIYRAIFKTDARHAWDDWVANPPLDPAAWGLTLVEDRASDAPAAIRRFDPWTRLAPVLEINRVGNSERRQSQFEVLEPATIVLAATGEIWSGSLFDYAWLRNDGTQESVWEMSWSASYPAGGHKKNRQEMAFVRLDPGSYSVFYETDDSHAFDSWNSPRPTHPERWGATVFALANRDALKVTAMAPTPLPQVPPVPPVPPSDLPPIGSGKTLVDARELGNEQNVSQAFTLERPSRVRIVATGEISMSGRYDYGWIESADGTNVWEMTYDNTRPAGGDDANRRFDGAIELPAGSYVFRFATDFSHAYGDFGNEGPAQPSSWGIVAELLPK